MPSELRCDTWQGKGLQVAKNRVGKYPESFRRMAVERLKDCASVSALADELGVHRTLLYQWQRKVEDSDRARFNSNVSCA
jgi:transposase-like protein